MKANRVINKIDVRTHHNRHSYSGGSHHHPGVTIRNIVTVDPPPRYGNHSQCSQQSKDSDYDRAKFLSDERSKYWRNLKELYSDYALIKAKQQELFKGEDNYVNKHCIEETVKLQETLKEKIKAQCKDIIFINNLFGDSKVNMVVQSIADGEELEAVLKKTKNITKQQRKLNKVRKFKTAKKKKTSKQKSVEKEEGKVHKAPETEQQFRRKPAINEPKFFDSELHWCQACNIFPATIKKYLQHLHDESHKNKIRELKINEHPWHKCLPEEQAWRSDITDTVRIKAFNFFVPVNGWFCTLCRSWMGDIHCAATHLKSYVHNMNLKNFKEKFPKWKQGWLDERAKALGKTIENRKDTINASTEKNESQEPSDESSDEEDTSEISRHRNVKPKMWVPNQKAFERVRNEISSAPSDHTAPKIKIVKKDKPAFIGKMPLISSQKKIVMKKLPTNTSEKIASSCAQFDEIQARFIGKNGGWVSAETHEGESEVDDPKLKKFIKQAQRIKKGKKKHIQIPVPVGDYVPIVENTANLENIIGAESIAQWENDINYQLRQMAAYQIPSRFPQMAQPFLLDPYHALALHNQHYYSNNMMSNQYDKFEIVSHEDEKSYSQSQESLSHSPRLTENKDKKRDINQSDNAKKKHQVDNTEMDESTRKKKTSQTKQTSLKKPTAVIKKPPQLKNTKTESDPSEGVLPSFKESFLLDCPDDSYISTLFATNTEMKILSSDKLYKKKKKKEMINKRYRKKNKLQREQDIQNQDNTGTEGESDLIEVEVEDNNSKDKQSNENESGLGIETRKKEAVVIENNKIEAGAIIENSKKEAGPMIENSKKEVGAMKENSEIKVQQKTTDKNTMEVEESKAKDNINEKCKSKINVTSKSEKETNQNKLEENAVQEKRRIEKESNQKKLEAIAMQEKINSLKKCIKEEQMKLSKKINEAKANLTRKAVVGNSSTDDNVTIKKRKLEPPEKCSIIKNTDDLKKNQGLDVKKDDRTGTNDSDSEVDEEVLKLYDISKT